ncbi:chemotaxis protein [Novimethylophilus kurashikiensis]|uniref:Chemotaxis protein n=1 Tax=Novimethylophilus kurashikiensis TaxID=1825523 RepID=A0A2R5FEG3_9PROT|nr:hypothetical protein [Novimethylophilus kurashikiensis]GBG14844.1 chemotaxis protein [Novimethylophilus kurashikiensis]
MTNHPNRLTIAAAVKLVMERDGKKHVWFGQERIWHEAYELARGAANVHPNDVWKRVRSALAASNLFEQTQYIRAADWSGREILHPRYVLKSKPDQYKSAFNTKNC